ncbi:Hypothetical predicted protein, partial [Pelobates cultripes]
NTEAWHAATGSGILKPALATEAIHAVGSKAATGCRASESYSQMGTSEDCVRYRRTGGSSFPGTSGILTRWKRS